MVHIKAWFLTKNLTNSQRQLLAEGETEKIDETEKAVKIRVTSDNGDFTFWCPKSCLTDAPEKLTAEQLEEHRANGVTMECNGHKIIVKEREVKSYSAMGFKIVK